jgi:hypothetical protein
MAVMLLALSAGLALLSRNFFCFWYSFLQKVSKPQVHGALEGLNKLKKNSTTSPGLETATLQLVALCFKQLSYHGFYSY